MKLLLPRTLALETARLCESSGGGNSTDKLDVTGVRALRTVSCAEQQREAKIFELRTV